MQRSYFLIILMLCTVAVARVAMAAEVTRGGMLSNSCAACHGTDGKSPGAIPSINGKSAEYISQAMHDFRDGKRSATVMGRHASGYSDEDIELIADYFSSRP
ncbi:MAG: cytochrome c [Gammaproteobacteria bacterium]|nr:cytochrome c [Gammaproteobacteria bacterium]MBT8135359.1 cytochrome c [Gammaproteobacteria bacterium]NNJ50991.1 cytochrome c [Gammaproteobacteria bacterium]